MHVLIHIGSEGGICAAYDSMLCLCRQLHFAQAIRGLLYFALGNADVGKPCTRRGRKVCNPVHAVVKLSFVVKGSEEAEEQSG